MKTLLTAILLGTVGPAFGQTAYSFTDPDYYQLIAGNYNPSSFDYRIPWFIQDKTFDTKGLDTIRVLNYENGKLERTEISAFNEKGQMTYYSNGFSPEDMYDTFEYSDTLRTAINHFSKKFTSRSDYSYMDGNVVKSRYHYNGKLKGLYSYRYENGKCVESVSEYYKRRKTFVHRLEDTYDELTGLKTTSAFYKNGKLVRTWNYTCDEKGSISENNDLAAIGSICTYTEEKNDGSYTEFKRIIQNGETVLIQSDYRADSSLVLERKFLKDTLLVYSYDLSDPAKNVRKSFSENGKLRYHEEQLKRPDGKIGSIQYYDRKNRMTSKLTYLFDSKDAVCGIKTEGYKNNVYEQKVVYSYR